MALEYINGRWCIGEPEATKIREVMGRISKICEKYLPSEALRRPTHDKIAPEVQKGE